MSIKIALAGNPNCGKTTMFNEFTGSSQYVGNWPGVTVEKKEGKLKGYGKDIVMIDLPGIYSLSPYTMEEVVTRNFLINEKPDVIINIVDASNLERNLYLTTQLMEVGVPVIIALNMMDIVQKRGDRIDTIRLAKELDCEIVETSALKGTGISNVVERAIALAGKKKLPNAKSTFNEQINISISEIETILNKSYNFNNLHWHSIKVFERDEKIFGQLSENDSAKQEIEAIISRCEEEMDDSSESIITNQRYDYIGTIVKKCLKKSNNGVSASDRVDHIVTNRWLALPIFVVVMWGIYYAAITIGTMGTDWINDVLFGDILTNAVSGWMEAGNVAEWLQDLVVTGILGGVGTVLSFLPQIFVLFFLIGILEDCGYMARIAFIMDRVFRRFGFSGKSFIPLLIASGCGVPGVMASRTIENERDRRLTIMMTTFIPCSAKLPIIALFAGALFGGSSMIATSVYLMSIVMVVICGMILKKTKLFAGDVSPFVMELPAYHMPAMKGVLIHMWDRAKHFMMKAGTIILVACCAIWFLQKFNWSMQEVDTSESILASIGRLIAPIFAPLGFGDWQAAVAIITGLVAKENVVATYGILFGISDASEQTSELLQSIAGMFTFASAYAFIVFNMLCPPCFAAIGAIRREMGSVKWTWITLGFQTFTAYLTAFVINQVGSALFNGGSILNAIISVLVVAAVISALMLIAGDRKKVRAGAELGYGK